MPPLAPSQQAGNLSPTPNHIFRLVVDQIETAAILLMDLQGRLTFWNQRAEHLLGYPPEEVLGTSFTRFFTTGDIQNGRPEHELREAVSTGQAADENWLIRNDGSRFWGHEIIRTLRDQNGQFAALLKVVTDRTERLRAEEERTQILARERAAETRAKAEEDLRKAEERFCLLVESVKDYAIFLLDPNGLVISWNAGAERTYGYRQEDILGKHVQILSPPKEHALGRVAQSLTVAEAERRDESEGWRVRRDDSLFWADVVITALHDPDGRLIGFAKVTRDLTEKKRAPKKIGPR